MPTSEIYVCHGANGLTFSPRRRPPAQGVGGLHAHGQQPHQVRPPAGHDLWPFWPLTSKVRLLTYRYNLWSFETLTFDLWPKVWLLTYWYNLWSFDLWPLTSKVWLLTYRYHLWSFDLLLWNWLLFLCNLSCFDLWPIKSLKLWTLINPWLLKFDL